MSLIMSCNNINKTVGNKQLFRNLTFTLFEQERVGIMGPNGAGKSTLLKIFAGLEQPDSGDISSKKGLKKVFLNQDIDFSTQKNSTELLLEALDGYDLELYEKNNKVSEMVELFQLPTKGQLAQELSGGWKKRLAIAQALIQEPDLLILDEPTNHLDAEGITLIEDILKKGRFSLMVVTHDRRFLENVVQKIIEISPFFSSGHLVLDAGYKKFLEVKADHLLAEERKKATLENQIRREKIWLDKAPKARGTKSKSRVDQAYELMAEHQEIRSRHNLRSETNLAFESNRKTRNLITVEKISKSYADKKLFSDLSLTIHPGLRLGVVGKNGSGKSSFLKILSRDLQPDSGTVHFADNLNIIYFDQNRNNLDPNETLKRSLVESGDFVFFDEKSIHIISYIQRFLFRADQLDTPVKKLSGGEQARLSIAKLMLMPADVLILDEPTNDLDIMTIENLETTLLNFSGAIILVTHDRFMIESVTNKILLIEEKPAFFADVSQLENLTKIQKTSSKDKTGKQSQPATSSTVLVSTRVSETYSKKKAKKLSFQEKREFDGMEETLAKLELELEVELAKLNAVETQRSPEQLRTVSQNIKTIQDQIEQKYKRWDELQKIQAESL